jgi:hypothetical protein
MTLIQRLILAENMAANIRQIVLTIHTRLAVHIEQRPFTLFLLHKTGRGGGYSGFPGHRVAGFFNYETHELHENKSRFISCPLSCFGVFRGLNLFWRRRCWGIELAAR